MGMALKSKKKKNHKKHNDTKNKRSNTEEQPSSCPPPVPPCMSWTLSSPAISGTLMSPDHVFPLSWAPLSHPNTQRKHLSSRPAVLIIKVKTFIWLMRSHRIGLPPRLTYYQDPARSLAAGDLAVSRFLGQSVFFPPLALLSSPPAKFSLHSSVCLVNASSLPISALPRFLLSA